jgi:hypothetical protein
VDRTADNISREQGARTGCLAAAFGIVAALITVPTAAIVILWLIGRLVTDRWWWSQWLFWIPTISVIALSTVCVVLTCLKKFSKSSRNSSLARWSITTLGLLAYFLFVEHRFFTAAAPINLARNTPGQLRIVHWNCQDQRAKPDEVIDCLRALDGDVIFITDLNWMTWVALQDDPLGTGNPPLSFGSICMVSRLPILQFRPLVSSPSKIIAAQIELDALALVGRTIKVRLMDLPSDPRIGRTSLMHKTHLMLVQANADKELDADMVIGDLNTPRGSASLSIVARAMHEAFAEGGHGYGASFPRVFPLYHIDHVLLSSEWKTLRYDLVNTGLGRHVAQIAWVKPAHSPPHP